MKVTEIETDGERKKKQLFEFKKNGRRLFVLFERVEQEYFGRLRLLEVEIVQEQFRSPSG